MRKNADNRGPRSWAYLLAWSATALFAMALSSCARAADLEGTVWRASLETRRLGPVETILIFERDGEGVRVTSPRGAIDVVNALPGTSGNNAVPFENALFEAVLLPTEDGYAGTMSAPSAGPTLSIKLENGNLTGGIDGGWLNGGLSAVPVEAPGAPLRDYGAILEALKDVVSQKIFQPKDLETAGYHTFLAHMKKVAAAAHGDLDFLLGFHMAWVNDPFSHFDLRRSHAPAAAMLEYFDGMRIGREMARVSYDGDIAILRVDTMMGLDTIEYIDQHYDDITGKGSKALIIDLRGNEGGAFAVKPLAGHLLSAPFEPGYFLSRNWNAEHDRLPTPAELAALEPWQGFSVASFWRDVQEQGVLKVRFEPSSPHFAGPVFVLTDSRSASATEMAVDALKGAGRVTVVGERTAGQMLSQMPMDVVEGFQVFLPIADYYSLTQGRIEGAGIAPDIEVSGEEAMEYAKNAAREQLGK